MDASRKPISVTQPYLPSLKDFIPYPEQIWEYKWLTNAEPFYNELKAELVAQFSSPVSESGQLAHPGLSRAGTLSI